MNALALWINLALVAGLVAVLSSASLLLGPQRRAAGAKGQPYETGMSPLEPAAGRMTVSYYRFAVLFVIFDIDLALLLPWVLMRDRLSLGAVAAFSLFLGLVALTLAYLWRKGALEFS